MKWLTDPVGHSPRLGLQAHFFGKLLRIRVHLSPERDRGTKRGNNTNHWSEESDRLRVSLGLLVIFVSYTAVTLNRFIRVRGEQ